MVTRIYNGAVLAGWWRRFAARLIDDIPFFVVVFLILFDPPHINSASWILVGAFLLAIVLINRAYVQGRTGRSLGKFLLSIRLVNADTGLPPGPVLTLVRSVAHIADNLFGQIGYLLPLHDERNRTLADMMCKTVVVVDKDQLRPDQPSWTPAAYRPVTNKWQPSI